MNSKVFKVIVIIGIVLLVFAGFAFATEEDLDEENVVQEDTSAEDALAQVATVTSVTSLSNLPEANLGLNNILNILLLAVGFLLILFAIAILIRLKK